MTSVVVLALVAAGLEAARWYARMIDSDGYGRRPPQASHTDPFTGRAVR
jgi:hypothetical protein